MPGRIRSSRRPLTPFEHRGSERGQMLVIFAMAMVALVGMVGLIIDGGDTALQRRDQQNVADAAAMAAGYAYVNDTDETAAARAVAAANGYVDGTNNTSVTVNIGSDTITVDVTRPHRNYFAGVMGFNSWTVSTTATVLAGVPNGAYGAMPIIFNKKAFDASANRNPSAPASFQEPPPGPEDVPQTTDTFNWTIFGTGSGLDDNERTSVVTALINNDGTSTVVYLDDSIAPLNAGTHNPLFDSLADVAIGTAFPVAIVDDSGNLVAWSWFHLTGSVGGSTKEISGWFDGSYNPGPMTITQGHGNGNVDFPPIVHLIN